MNLARLRYFVVVAEMGNIVRAAKALRVAQPALSRQLKALEKEVGAPLLERHARGVRLTDAGHALLVHAREALASVEAAVAAARRVAEGAPTLRVAFLDWPHRSSMVARAIDDLRARVPDAQVEYDTAPWTSSVASLHAEAIDVGFGIAPDASLYGEGIRGDWIMPEPGSCAILPASHPLARRRSVTLADLRDVPALVPAREHVGMLHDMMVGLIRSGGYEPRVVTCPANFSAGTQMAAAGAGWIISVLSIGEFVPPGTAVLPIDDASIMCGLFALTRVDDNRTLVRDFIDALRRAAGPT